MTPVLTKLERYRSDFLTFESSLAHDGAPWLHEVRQRALSSFDALGFPTATRGNEKWKYTNVAPIAKATFAYPFDLSPADVKAASLRRLVPWDERGINLVFIDGRYAAPLSREGAAAQGVRAMNLADAIRTDGDIVQKHLTRHATLEDDGFVALNTAFLRDGAFVYLPEGCSLPAPLHLVFVTGHQGQPIAAYPRILIVAGAHSKLTVMESYLSLAPVSYFTDAVAEIVMGEGAEVEHYRFLMESPQAFHVGTTSVYQARDSTFRSTSFARGAALARDSLSVLLDAPGSSCFLNGLYLTSGTQHIDHHINIDHAQPHTTSNQYFKGILDGQSRAVFSGRVLVRRDAQKTMAHQADKNLLLSEGARVNTKPSLEIYADDVKCGHGATAGALTEEALFYMRSRGLDMATARVLLIQGFASEIIDAVPLPPLRAYLEGWLAKALPSLAIEGPS